MKVLTAKQTPGNNNKGGEWNTKDHPQNATQGRAPEEYRDHNHYWMKTSLLAHDFWG